MKLRLQTWRSIAILAVLLATPLVINADAVTDRDVIAARSPDRVVFPTGEFPTDVQNIQAAVDLGGTVLLKPTSAAGIPTAFNFGPAAAGSGTVHLSTEVNILGETVGRNRTTIVGGNVPFRSYAPLRSVIQGIFFDGPRAAAVHVGASTGFEFSDNRVARVVSFPFSVGMKAQGVWVGGWDVVGTILIADNIFEDAGRAEFGYGVVVFPDRAEVTIAHNTIRGAGLAGILASPGSGQTVIEDNYVAPGPFNPDFPSYGNGIHLVGTFTGGTVTVRHNEVLCESSEADGIILIGFSGGYGPLQNSVIEKNEITLGKSNYGGITLVGEVSYSIVKNNKLNGYGAFGLDIVQFGPDAVAESNTFQGNNVTDFTASSADLFLDQHTRNTVANGHFETVMDLGIGNRITGASKVGQGERTDRQRAASRSNKPGLSLREMKQPSEP